MTKLHFETRIHAKPLSAFQHQNYENHQFMLAVLAHNAAALAANERWANCQPMVENPVNTTAAIEQICQLFIENYQTAQRINHPESKPRSGEQIIESVGIFWLDQQGKGYVYQAGKCLFTILKKKGFPIPVKGSGMIQEICLEQGDRLVLDLKRADIAGSLYQTINSLSVESDLAAQFSRYHYPFSLTSVTLENRMDPALQTGKFNLQSGDNHRHGPDEEVFKPRPATQAAPPWRTARKSEKSTSRFKFVFIVLFLTTSTAFLLFFLKKPGFQLKPDKLDPGITADSILYDSSQSLSLQDHRLEQKIKNKRMQPLMDSAQYALNQANEHLQNGENMQALIELDSAERRFERYLSFRPATQAAIIPLLNEIRHKRRLIKEQGAF